EAVKILIFAAEGLTKRSAVGFLLRSLIMFQTFISRHNSNFFSDKLVLTSVTPASSAPVLQTPKATSSTLYFDSLTVNAGNGEIGRASCRERVAKWVGGGPLSTQEHHHPDHAGLPPSGDRRRHQGDHGLLSQRAGSGGQIRQRE